MQNRKKFILSRNMIIMIIVLLIVFGGIFGWGIIRSIFIKRYFANFQPPPVTISTAKATAVVWQPYLSAVGSVVAINGVQVTTEVAGLVEKISFESGQMVKQGDPIIQLDDAEDRQDLKNFQAQLDLAQITYRRQSILYKGNNVARADLDQATASLQQAQANVGKTLVLIDKKNIKAPFAGKLGIRLVNLGQYIAAGTAIVSLQSMDPLYIQFSLPEQNLNVLTVNQPIEIRVESEGDKVFIGKISALNSEVDANTRNILVQAVVPNPQYLLYPGMFANVRVLLPQKENVIAVPQTAVIFSLYGDAVYVVKPEGKDKEGKPILKAHLHYVTTGERRGNEVIILKGIQAGDEVVISGQLKLNEGAPVLINNTIDLEKPIFESKS